jgi:hypothetical protein
MNDPRITQFHYHNAAKDTLALTDDEIYAYMTACFAGKREYYVFFSIAMRGPCDKF